VPELVETSDPDGVDFGWVMQTTFVLTIVLGAPVVALASIPASLPTWGARLSFAVRVGAIVWVCVALGAYLYARRMARQGRAEASPTQDSEASANDQDPLEPDRSEPDPPNPTTDGGETSPKR
jgi:hypothetical protein